jgi:hypothetical protein
MSNTVYVVLDCEKEVEGVYSCIIRAQECKKALGRWCMCEGDCDCPEPKIEEMVVDES